MSYIITDNINYIEVDNGTTIFYLKKKYEVDIVSNVIHLENCECKTDFIDLPFSEILSPSASSITDMRALLQSYNNTTGDQVLSSLGASVELGATKIEQYVQTDTFNLILEELQQIKTLLKKIYQ